MRRRAARFGHQVRVQAQLDALSVRHWLAHAYHVLRHRHPAWGVLLGAIAATIVLGLFARFYVDPATPGERTSLLQTTAQLVGGSALLAGVYLSWRTLQVNREGQITERFTRAIDQLGATDDEGRPRLEVRLGGIYALERIARDSERDHGPILETLTAYVREHNPNQQLLRVFDAEPPEPPGHDSREPWRQSADIQAILTVLGRRSRLDTGSQAYPLDLTYTDLRAAQLAGGRFEATLLVHSDLRRAILIGAHLERANLTGALFAGAMLGGARLRSANLQQIDLSGVDLQHTDFQGATFWRTDFRHSVLYNALFQSCNLNESRFGGAKLQWSNFTGAALPGVNLSDAVLSNAILDGTDFSGAYLYGTDLRHVDLRSTVGLTREQLAEAITDETTLLPDYL